MGRLIDTMTEVELSSKVLELCSFHNISDWVHIDDLKQGLEALFASAPHWSENLDPLDNQTWVLCFVSNVSASCTWHTCWICKVNSDGSYSPSTASNDWLYATPIDLDLRYKEGDK